MRRPENLATLQLRYDPSDSPFDVTFNASYVDEQADNFFPPFPALPQIVTLDSYVLLDVAARYRFGDNYEVFARIENALDEEYEDVFGFATPDLGASVGIRFLAGR